MKGRCLLVVASLHIQSMVLFVAYSRFVSWRSLLRTQLHMSAQATSADDHALMAQQLQAAQFALGGVYR